MQPMLNRPTADAIEARAEEFADAESLDTGKPRSTLVDDEILLSVDQIRFFAGAARNLEGRAAGENMTDHTVFIRPEPTGAAIGDHTTPQLVSITGSVRAGMAVAALAAYARDNARTGTPREADILFGPVNNAHQLARVTGLAHRLPDHVVLELGGRRIGRTCYFHETTIVSGLL
jgi:acyl-CoA reductase-like NAD-dependent aldehyde dehydrogenase